MYNLWNEIESLEPEPIDDYYSSDIKNLLKQCLMKKLEDRPDTFKLLQENEFLKRSLKRIKIGDIKPFEPHI